MKSKRKADSAVVTLRYGKTMSIVPVSEILRYEKFKGRPLKTFTTESLRHSDVLRHWCANRYSDGKGTTLYGSFRVETLVDHIRRLDYVDMDQPILIVGGKVCDGIHRIIKALLTGVETLQGYEIPDEDVKELVKLYSTDEQ